MSIKLILMLILFMSVVLGLYKVFPAKLRYLVLLFFSIVFYALYSHFATLYLLACIGITYLCGILINKQNDLFQERKKTLEKEERKKLKEKFKTRKKLILVFCIVLALAFLVVLKYGGFLVSIYSGFISIFGVKTTSIVVKFAIPLGISYYTLSAIGYMIDVYRGKYEGERNFFKVALFVAYFPQLIEGPFANYDKLAPQLCDGHDLEGKRVSRGFMLMLWGFFKYKVIADRLAIIVSYVFKTQNIPELSGLIIVLGMLAFTFELYAEFSGIIEIVSGVSEMFGISLAKNFQQPFFSQNVSEFWRRWHISLGTWFKDYIFYPVSMCKPVSKITKKLQGKMGGFWEVFIPSVVALFFVWFLNGLWHGPSWKYVVYGLYYYVLMLISLCLDPLFTKLYNKINLNKDCLGLKIFRIARTFVLVNIGLMMFRAVDLSTFFNMLARIFQSGKVDIIGESVIDVYDFVLCFVGVAILLTVDAIKEKGVDIIAKIQTKPIILYYVCCVALIFAVVIFGAYGNGYIPPDPIYGGF